ncbi:MAG: hypothetical protein V4733_03290 [Verrucomicrobiota bacterium]
MTDKPAQVSARSPIAGCAILITALLVIGFLIVFSVVALFRQFNAIEKFTSDRPQPVAIELTSGREAEISALTGKLKAFAAALDETETTGLVLTPAEMNLAIATWEPFKELRGTVRAAGGTDGALVFDISFPMNGKPRLARDGEPGWLASDPRYLVGKLTATPDLSQREVVLRIKGIDVPSGVTVPKEFMEQMSPYRITERYTTDRVIGPVMAKLSGVQARDGNLVLRRAKGETPKDSISRAEVESSTSRLFIILGVAATLFLLFAGTVVFIGLRAKRRKET